MKLVYSVSLIICIIFLNSFDEYDKLQKFELEALKNKIGKEYTYDLTGKEACNKTRIKYLGMVKTSKGKQYKILTSFFVFSAGSTCHGTSRIKVYDMMNRFLGDYNMGMPDELPDTLSDNKLIYLKNSEDCYLRKGSFVDLTNGLPKTFRILCAKDSFEYSFSDD